MSADLPVPRPIPAPDRGEAGKLHRELSGLMAEIAATRAARHTRSEGIRALHDRLQLELGPVEAKLGAARLETLRILGRHLAEGELRRRDAERLREALLGLADELESAFGFDLEEERTAFLGQEPRHGKALRVIQEAEPDREEPPRQARQGAGDGTGAGRGGKPGRRRAAEEHAIAGDVRALYLLLARALHPDKEPDPARREGKTSWMQKVTDAYGRRDLAGLLDILGQDPLGAVGPYLEHAPLKTVQGFAKRLRRELAALKAEAGSGREELHPSLRPFLGPQGINEKAIKRAVSELKQELRFVRERNEAYRRIEVVEEMAAELGKGDPRAYL